MRRLAIAALAAALTGAAPASAGRVTLVHDGAPAPAELLALLESMGSACERGDRSAFVALAPLEDRGAMQVLADSLVSSPAAPLQDVRVEVTTLQGTAASWSGSLVLLARVPPGQALADADAAGAPEGFTRAEPDTAGTALRFVARRAEDGSRPGLVLTAGFPATVTLAELDVRLDPQPPRARSHARLTLDASPRVALLEVGPGAWVRAASPGVALVPLARNLLRPGVSIVRVEWSEAATRGVVQVEADVPLPSRSVRGQTIVLLHQAEAVPFATGHHFRYVLTLDVPLPHRSVSVGTAEDLPAPTGRRRTRWTCDRSVDYLPLAAGPYSVQARRDGDAVLELWRTRDVGGDAPAILSELADIVRFQEQQVAPLPYRAMRLVELPTVEQLAVSYASMIFMGPGVLATSEQRAEVLSHEVGHQWWGNAVSPHPTARWASEGMATAMMDLFVLQRFGRERMLDRQDAHLRQILDGHGASSRPLATSPGGADAYDRGALFVHALRHELGDELFWRVLRRWYARLRDAEPTTSDFQREAEAEAGRPLGAVFGPWLGSTALPVVRMTWAERVGGTVPGVTVTLEQDEPPFPLDVPLRAVAEDGSREDWTLRLTGQRAAEERDLRFVPARVELDPDSLLPRVGDERLDAYLLHEADACLARGDAARARRLLEALDARSLLGLQGSVVLFAARVLDGADPDAARASLNVRLAELPTDEARQLALLADADALLTHGAAAAAVPLLQVLDAEVPDGQAVPRRLGLALRALGREDEAQAALQRALRRRPTHAATRAALGLAPGPRDSGSVESTLTALLPEDDPALKATSPDGLHAVACSGGRVAILLSGARKLICGRPGALAAVPGLAPSGAAALVAIGPDGPAPLLAILETMRLRSTITLVEMSADGRGRIVASHVRAPGGARAMVADGDGLLVAWSGPGSEWDWRRLAAPLRVSSEGPDDDDGLRRLVVDQDARFVPVTTTAEPAAGATGPAAVALAGLGLAVLQDERRRLAGSAGPAWEDLASGSHVLGARAVGDRLALVASRDPSASPFPEDALPGRALVVVSVDGVTELPLPDDAIDACLAADGTLILEREGVPRLSAGRLDLGPSQGAP